jgi:hypothetical protein
MYHAFALLQPKSDYTMALARDRLKMRFPDYDVAQNGDEITLTEGDWDYHLVLLSGQNVLEESEGLAGRISGLDDDAPMRTCDRRVEVWSDTNDPFMEYFERHFQVLDVLRSFHEVILVDPKEPCLL